jgi:hypothetical protein
MAEAEWLTSHFEPVRGRCMLTRAAWLSLRR